MGQAQARAALEVPPQDSPPVARARQSLKARYGVVAPSNRDQRRFFARALAYEHKKELVVK